MYRAILLCSLPSLLLSLQLPSQPVARPAITTYTYYPPTQDKASWQRLNLWLSSTYLFVAQEALADQDSCLLLASRSLGLSRFSILAEGYGDEKLAARSAWIDRADPAAGVRMLSGTAGKEYLQLLLLLGAYYAFQPRSYARYKDSVQYFLYKAIAISRVEKEEKMGRIASCLLGKVYLQGNDARGDSILQQLLDQCQQARDREMEVRAIAVRGMYTIPHPTTFERKVNDLEQAASGYQQISNTEGAINMLTDLGYMYLAMGALTQANEKFLKALSLAEGIQYPYTHYNSENVAMVTFFQGKFGEPLRYLHQTIRVAESTRDSLAWSYFYARKSTLLEAEGRYTEGLAMAQKAIDRFVIDRNPSVYLLLNNIITALSEMGQVQQALNMAAQVTALVGPPTTVIDKFCYYLVKANCHLHREELDSAERYIPILDSLETIMENVRGPFRRNTIHELQANIHFARGQYRKARQYAFMHFTFRSTSERSLMNDLRTYRLLIRIDSALNDQAAMVSHYQQYAKLLDSNFKVTKIRQAEELQIQYETQEKERQITGLNERAKQTRLIQNLSLVGIIAVMIIAALLYRQNRLRRKNNQLITHKNDQLQELLADKEWLLKEVHHRVKNNLEIIMSLLSSQSRYIDNDAALTAINDSQRRVHAISLIHQKLYQTENGASIDMRPYIDELISYLQESFGTPSRAVIEQDVDPVRLDVAKAIPLGLIINEGLVNAVKYAFPGSRKGLIRVSLHQIDTDQWLLTIADNGTGLRTPGCTAKKDSLGFSLMRGLARQLDGTLHVENNNGLRLSIRFSPQISTLYEQE